MSKPDFSQQAAAPAHGDHALPVQAKHALVTGGGRGIGAAIARSLVEAGYRVTITGRDGQRLQQMAQSLGPQCQAVSMDVTRKESVAQAFAQARERWGAVSVLVNNAGQAQSVPFHKMGEEVLNTLWSVNLMGVFYCIQQVLPDMQAQGGGRIIQVASTAGLRGYAYVSAYAAVKHAVIGLTRSLALELASQGITVNAVCPGFTDTDLLDQAVHNIVQKTGRSAEQARAELAKNNPQGRLIQPQEVAHAVCWLVSEGARSITGQSIAVAGGEVM